MSATRIVLASVLVSVLVACASTKPTGSQGSGPGQSVAGVPDTAGSGPSSAGSELGEQRQNTSAAPAVRRSIVLMQFAVASPDFENPYPQPMEACPHTGGNKASDKKIDTKVLAELMHDLQKKLSKKYVVTVENNLDAIPVNATVVSGCITTIDRGSMAKRMIGFNLGASHLAVHVRIMSKQEPQMILLNEFDIKVKGASLMPPMGPIGVATLPIKEYREDIFADSRKLSDRVSDKINKLGI